MKKLLAIFCLMMVVSTSIKAQQDLLLSQQFYSRINKNPAATGNVSDMDFFLLGHYQYIDVKDAPKSFLFNFQSYNEKYKSGYGASISYDNLGVAKSITNAKLVYAYAMNLNEGCMLSFGVSAGVQYGYFNVDEYTFSDPSEVWDGDVPSGKETKLSPDFDFGAEITTPQLILGASITHLTSNGGTSLVSGRHFYAYARYLWKISDIWDVAPSLAFMHRDKIEVLEVGATALFKRFVWGGITWHPDMHSDISTNPVAFTLGVEYQRYRIGYTFDWAFGKVSRLSGNSHEIMFSYSLPSKAKKEVYEKFE